KSSRKTAFLLEDLLQFHFTDSFPQGLLSPFGYPVCRHYQIKRACVCHVRIKGRTDQAYALCQCRKMAAYFFLYDGFQPVTVVMPDAAANRENLEVERGNNVIERTAKPFGRMYDGSMCVDIAFFNCIEQLFRRATVLRFQITSRSQRLGITVITAATLRLGLIRQQHMACVTGIPVLAA